MKSESSTLPLHHSEFLACGPDAYRCDIVDFLWDDFDIVVSLDTVSDMLKREYISRKKVRMENQHVFHGVD